MTTNKQIFQKGFTLIELLVVIAIIAILAVVVFVALDPVTRFADARNSRRWTDVNSILTAVHEYIVDNDGSLPSGLSTSMSITQIGTSGSGCNSSCSTASASACVNMNSTLARYLKSMPTDPDEGTQSETGYYVYVNNNNIVTVGACAPENSETVEVSR
ncbi:type II secretion system protein [Candidatus Woesebacteria bacterium]|nr:type II secretion system protein [Candidatus Woesebacteria bacterium]